MMKLRSRYGSAAIILSTREVKEGGLLGSGILSKKMYEIDFMLEEKSRRKTELLPPGRRNKLLEKYLDSTRAPAPEIERKAPKIAEKPEMPLPTRERIVMEKATPEELQALFADTEMDVSAPAEEIKFSPLHTKTDNSEFKNEEDIYIPPEQEFRKMDEPEETPFRSMHRIRKRLLSAHLSADFIDMFMNRLDRSLSQNEKGEYSKVQEKTLQNLKDIIRTTPEIAPPTGERRAVMLIGPSGMGKTTSIAKLAARTHIFQNRTVSIYSIDHYRLAATEQLKVYANVMNLPFHAPLTPEEFKESIRRDGSEIVLIDTSGISHKDLHRLEELQKFVDACEIRLEKHLVLAAGTTPDLTEKILNAYDNFGFDKIILTKVDETDFIGAFIELADKINRPFSFIMSGQDVPGDIQEAKPEELAKMILK